MGLFNWKKQADINALVQEARSREQAVLLDVRTPEEFAQGRIPGSQNVPLQSLDKVTNLVQNRSVPIYVYCLSGARSRQAAARLQSMGYETVINMGGIAAYSGKVER